MTLSCHSCLQQTRKVLLRRGWGRHRSLNRKIKLYQLLRLEFSWKGCRSSENRMVLQYAPGNGLFQTLQKEIIWISPSSSPKKTGFHLPLAFSFMRIKVLFINRRVKRQSSATFFSCRKTTVDPTGLLRILFPPAVDFFSSPCLLPSDFSR